jgi:alkylated DNA repair protein (DNA oxidative demethylase)
MILPEGFRALPFHLDEAAQRALLGQVHTVLAAAPLYRARMPKSGQPLSVLMSNAGTHGWISDIAGYRYAPRHPQTGLPWPAVPPLLLQLWADLAPWKLPPQCCLINFYRGPAKMGLHRDQDEEAADAPILNLSLGDTALFRLGGPGRRDPTTSFKVTSGTVMLFAGASRHVFHGVDRVMAGTSGLIEGGGRISLTLRRVTPGA